MEEFELIDTSSARLPPITLSVPSWFPAGITVSMRLKVVTATGLNSNEQLYVRIGSNSLATPQTWVGIPATGSYLSLWSGSTQTFQSVFDYWAQGPIYVDFRRSIVGVISASSFTTLSILNNGNALSSYFSDLLAVAAYSQGTEIQGPTLTVQKAGATGEVFQLAFTMTIGGTSIGISSYLIQLGINPLSYSNNASGYDTFQLNDGTTTYIPEQRLGSSTMISGSFPASMILGKNINILLNRYTAAGGSTTNVLSISSALAKQLVANAIFYQYMNDPVATCTPFIYASTTDQGVNLQVSLFCKFVYTPLALQVATNNQSYVEFGVSLPYYTEMSAQQITVGLKLYPTSAPSQLNTHVTLTNTLIPGGNIRPMIFDNSGASVYSSRLPSSFDLSPYQLCVSIGLNGANGCVYPAFEYSPPTNQTILTTTMQLAIANPNVQVYNWFLVNGSQSYGIGSGGAFVQINLYATYVPYSAPDEETNWDIPIIQDRAIEEGKAEYQRHLAQVNNPGFTFSQSTAYKNFITAAAAAGQLNGVITAEKVTQLIQRLSPQASVDTGALQSAISNIARSASQYNPSEQFNPIAAFQQQGDMQAYRQRLEQAEIGTLFNAAGDVLSVNPGLSAIIRQASQQLGGLQGLIPQASPSQFSAQSMQNYAQNAPTSSNYLQWLQRGATGALFAYDAYNYFNPGTPSQMISSVTTGGQTMGQFPTNLPELVAMAGRLMTQYGSLTGNPMTDWMAIALLNVALNSGSTSIFSGESPWDAAFRNSIQGALRLTGAGVQTALSNFSPERWHQFMRRAPLSGEYSNVLQLPSWFTFPGDLAQFVVEGAVATGRDAVFGGRDVIVNAFSSLAGDQIESLSPSEEEKLQRRQANIAFGERLRNQGRQQAISQELNRQFGPEFQQAVQDAQNEVQVVQRDRQQILDDINTQLLDYRKKGQVSRLGKNASPYLSERGQQTFMNTLSQLYRDQPAVAMSDGLINAIIDEASNSVSASEFSVGNLQEFKRNIKIALRNAEQNVAKVNQRQVPQLGLEAQYLARLQAEINRIVRIYGSDYIENILQTNVITTKDQPFLNLQTPTSRLNALNTLLSEMENQLLAPYGNGYYPVGENGQVRRNPRAPTQPGDTITGFYPGFTRNPYSLLQRGILEHPRKEYLLGYFYLVAGSKMSGQDMMGCVDPTLSETVDGRNQIIHGLKSFVSYYIPKIDFQSPIDSRLFSLGLCSYFEFAMQQEYMRKNSHGVAQFYILKSIVLPETQDERNIQDSFVQYIHPRIVYDSKLALGKGEYSTLSDLNQIVDQPEMLQQYIESIQSDHGRFKNAAVGGMYIERRNIHPLNVTSKMLEPVDRPVFKRIRTREPQMYYKPHHAAHQRLNDYSRNSQDELLDNTLYAIKKRRRV